MEQIEEGLHIIGCNVFPFFLLDGFDVVYKVLNAPDVMRGMPYQWPKVVSQLLGHPLCDCHTLLDTLGLRWCPVCVFWGLHRIWGPTFVG